MPVVMLPKDYLSGIVFGIICCVLVGIGTSSFWLAIATFSGLSCLLIIIEAGVNIIIRECKK